LTGPFQIVTLEVGELDNVLPFCLWKSTLHFSFTRDENECFVCYS